MKKKLNWVAIGNLVGLISGGYYMIYTFYMICIKPFITNKIISMTNLGLIIFILSIFVVASNFRYFEERLEK